MNPRLHLGKLFIVTMALACGGLAASVGTAQAVTQPAAAMSTHAQLGWPYTPPDPC